MTKDYPTTANLDFSPDGEALAVAIFAVGQSAGAIEILDTHDG